MRASLRVSGALVPPIHLGDQGSTVSHLVMPSRHRWTPDSTGRGDCWQLQREMGASRECGTHGEYIFGAPIASFDMNEAIGVHVKQDRSRLLNRA